MQGKTNGSGHSSLVMVKNMRIPSRPQLTIVFGHLLHVIPRPKY